MHTAFKIGKIVQYKWFVVQVVSQLKGLKLTFAKNAFYHLETSSLVDFFQKNVEFNNFCPYTETLRVVLHILSTI